MPRSRCIQHSATGEAGSVRLSRSSARCRRRRRDVIARQRSARPPAGVESCQREQRRSAIHRQTTTSPSRAQRRSREHGFGGGRRRAAGEAGEHRRVPTPRFVVQRGGSCGERGIRTLGRLLTYVRLASGWGCPHRPVLALRAARFLPPPNSVLAASPLRAEWREAVATAESSSNSGSGLF